ncbi:MAG TPA: protein kinase, partial [Candidatus Xenobia bacterium]
MVEQFRREAQMLHLLQHDNLPRVHDFFEEGGRHYLVMDYIQGVTLEETIRFEPASEAQVLGWSQELCQVLDYLHTHSPPIIFRDLKPSNIMLGDDGGIKLIDFGIAKDFDVDTGRGTRTTVRGAGTPGFAAPEQYGTGTDVRTDIYSLGATLYCLLTRSIPPDATDRAGGALDLKPLPELRPDVSAQTAQVIGSMMSLNRNQRPGSIREVAEALGLALLDRASGPRSGPRTAPVPVPAGAATPNGATVLSAMARQAAETNRPAPSPATTSPATRLEAAPVTRALPPAGPARGPLLAAVGALVLAIGGGGYWVTHQTLDVRSEPKGAEIVRAGVAGPYPKTPHRFSGLMLNSHFEATLRLPGYKPAPVAGEAGHPMANATLEPMTRELWVSSSQAAWLSIDGQDQGPVGRQPTAYQLAPGPHNLVVRPKDEEHFQAPLARTVNVPSDGDPKPETFPIGRLPGHLTVMVPRGAHVTVAGHEADGPRADFPTLPAGKVQVTVTGGGYQEAQTRQVDIPPGAKGRIIAFKPPEAPVRPVVQPVSAAGPSRPHPQAAHTVVVMPAPVAHPGITGHPRRPPVRPIVRRPVRRKPHPKRPHPLLQQWLRHHPRP